MEFDLIAAWEKDQDVERETGIEGENKHVCERKSKVEEDNKRENMGARE